MQVASRILFAFSALCLAPGAVVHAAAYPKAAVVIDGSNLPARFAAIFKGLWLGDCATVFGVALAFALIAIWPRLASKPLIVLLALLPVASAAAIYATVGNFLPGHLLLVAGGAALLGVTNSRVARRST
ncbi:MAG: hypothetical protein HY243_18085 [Proteobacteria bacterium]|nr:hypothetical protein [Pseudomonadota bacterium]